MNASVLILALAASLVAAAVTPRAQTPAATQTTDLDAFMSRVLERRDDNWKKLQQYVLDERETFTLTGPGATPLYGVRRESTWFPRDGRFIKSPLRINGVPISEEERRKAEEEWITREDGRETRRARHRSRRTGSARQSSPASSRPPTSCDSSSIRVTTPWPAAISSKAGAC
jgi:hypothetical protein